MRILPPIFAALGLLLTQSGCSLVQGVVVGSVRVVGYATEKTSSLAYQAGKIAVKGTAKASSSAVHAMTKAKEPAPAPAAPPPPSGTPPYAPAPDDPRGLPEPPQ